MTLMSFENSHKETDILSKKDERKTRQGYVDCLARTHDILSDTISYILSVNYSVQRVDLGLTNSSFQIQASSLNNIIDHFKYLVY